MTALDDLLAVASQLEALHDETAAFLAGEMRLAAHGIQRTTAAIAAGDQLGAGLWRRLAIEATLRFTWTAGAVWEEGRSGELIVDGETVRGRVARLRARDIKNLEEAYRAISETTDSEMAADLLDGLTKLASSFAVDPAPRSIRGLAESAPARALYSQHRMSSALTHPGAAIGDPTAWTFVTGRVEEISYLAAALARALADALNRAD
jgi:hypothetical protein